MGKKEKKVILDDIGFIITACVAYLMYNSIPSKTERIQAVMKELEAQKK